MLSLFEIFFFFFFHVHLFLSTERAVQHDPGLLCPAKNIWEVLWSPGWGEHVFHFLSHFI